VKSKKPIRPPGSKNLKLEGEDYYDKLSPDERAYLTKFNAEFNEGRGLYKRDALHKTKAQKRAAEASVRSRKREVDLVTGSKKDPSQDQ
jgi:hypothetical protein